ncbi:hypothetical protein [Bordetella genomosp. 12]|uniref:Uncharacterized protein n=1 Tax=Bordetella genomosp. 12 TaxID=463035 RepID=A0A261VKC1_9BORD|nr:hypothetical protein [Bordetella genomosp. 12]OZI74594.1 hypothetical protein CAL22_09050 [Bordetella genomosp. 12]
MSNLEFKPVGENQYEVMQDGQPMIICTRPGQSPEHALAESQQPEEPDYRDQRIREYPALNDQMDQVAKIALALRAAGMLPPVEQSVHDWLDHVAAVKAEFPKPEGQ